MSASFDSLKADVTAAIPLLESIPGLTAQVATLTQTVADQTAQIAKLKAEAGTPDADIDAARAPLEAAIAAATVPAPVTPSAS